MPIIEAGEGGGGVNFVTYLILSRIYCIRSNSNGRQILEQRQETLPELIQRRMRIIYISYFMGRLGPQTPATTLVIPLAMLERDNYKFEYKLPILNDYPTLHSQN